MARTLLSDRGQAGSWQKVARLAGWEYGARRGLFKNLLRPERETHEALFGRYKFNMDLSLGWLQKIYFLKPDVYEELAPPPLTLQEIG